MAEQKRDRRISRIAWLGSVAIRLIASTWRFEITNDDVLRRLRSQRRPIIFVFWHGQMLPLLYHHRHQQVSIMVSEHEDGEIITRIASTLGYRAVRGSTSRGAARALLAACRVLEDGFDVAISPDGPRGPARSFAPGAVVIAQRSGAPILPVGMSATSAWRLKSWDRFVIPRPFSRVRIVYGELTTVERERARAASADVPLVRDRLMDAERRAHA